MGSQGILLIVSNPLNPVQMLMDCIVHPAVSSDQGWAGDFGQSQISRIMGGTGEA
jgi:hypothetical protein